MGSSHQDGKKNGDQEFESRVLTTMPHNQERKPTESYRNHEFGTTSITLQSLQWDHLASKTFRQNSHSIRLQYCIYTFASKRQIMTNPSQPIVQTNMKNPSLPQWQPLSYPLRNADSIDFLGHREWSLANGCHETNLHYGYQDRNDRPKKTAEKIEGLENIILLLLPHSHHFHSFCMKVIIIGRL